MSLLIKALDKAQNAKTEQAQAEKSKIGNETENISQNKARNKLGADLELSLSPTGSSLMESGTASAASASSGDIQNRSNTASASPASTSSPTSNLSSKNAANVFSAKGVEAKNDNKRLALIAGAGLLALLAMGLYFYQFVDNTPDVVIPQRPIAMQPVPQLQQPENNANAASSVQTADVQKTVQEMPPAFESDNAAQLDEKQESPIKKLAKKMPKEQVVAENEEFAVAENTVEVSEQPASTKANKKIGKSKNLQFGEAVASPSASISVTKTKPQPSVNPALMSAYEAYNAGNDSEAQKLYKQVLQHDVRNVDALLGMGAIASRQGRVADANGWYDKVLELDPRNNIAQTALLDSQSQGNEQVSESHLKNMLAKQPDDANLHVALGNLYAEQNQWPAAQQAYFDAYKLNASADNAFNLAVSLDQMGKPKLALPYYQLALEKASGTSNIDKAALEARIAAIQ